MKSKESNELAGKSMSTEHTVNAATVDKKDHQPEALEPINMELAVSNLSFEQQKEVQTSVEQNQKKMSESEGFFGEPVYRYSKDPTSLTKFLKIMLWIYLGINVLGLLSDLMQIHLLNSVWFSQAQAESNDARQLIVGFLFLGSFIVTGSAFLKWIYQANSNCHGFGALGMEFSPGWSIGYYFIPFVNFYKPYYAMKEIWNVSTNPINWQSEQKIPLLSRWWTLWVIAGFLGNLSLRLSRRADTISSLQSSTNVALFLDIIGILLCLVAISLISTIFTKQEKL